LTIAGVSQHLISYYRVEDVENGRLRSPSSLPELATLEISPEYLDKTHFRQPPRVEYGPDGVPRYRGEADDPDLESIVRTADKNSRRFDPYGASSSPKRPKKSRSQRTASQSDADTVQYPAEAYHYPQYPGYPYPAGGYPYMQYPMTSPTDGTASDAAAYGSYMGGYYWPGYPSAGAPMIGGPDDDEDDGDEKEEVGHDAASAAV
jgi:Gti1/Pac2 family transcription factor